jgi:hypothetical protein
MIFPLLIAKGEPRLLIGQDNVCLRVKVGMLSGGRIPAIQQYPARARIEWCLGSTASRNPLIC